MTTTALTPTCQTTTDTAFTSAALVAALEDAWNAIRTQHSEIPAVVIVVGSGSPTKASQGLKYGHFATQTWQSGNNRMPEVLVSGEGLSRSAAEVFTTLLHEAVHALADVRDIQDTSRQGRWHNQRFAKLAAELGMATTKDDKLGFSPCTLTDDTAARFTPVIDGLTSALHAWRHVDMPAEGKAKTSNNGLAAECECPRKIRISKTAFDDGPIWCSQCDQAFLPDDIDRDAFNANNPRPIPGTDAGMGDGDDSDSDQEDEMVSFYDPAGDRFGIPTYPFKVAPQGLATLRQLRALDLRPNGQEPAAQMLWRRGKRVAYLYRIDLAAPKRTATPRQREALSRANEARRTCPSCGQIKDYTIPRRTGECLDCTPILERTPQS